MSREAAAEIKADLPPPQLGPVFWLANVRGSEDARGDIVERIAVQAKLEQAIAQINPVYVGQVILDLGDRALGRKMVGLLKDDLGEVSARLDGSGFNLQLFDLVTNDLRNVESHHTSHRIAEGFGAHGPARREPAGCAFHPHAELG